MIIGFGEKVYKWVCLAIVTIIALICLYPLLYTVFVSLVSRDEWTQQGGMIWFFPKQPTLVAYIKIFGSSSVIIRAIGVSFLRTLLGVTLGVTINALTAFIISRKNLPGKNVFMIIMLFTILFGSGIIPMYKTVEGLGLKNTIWALVLPGLFNGWNILIFKQFFENIPDEL